jgi:hypothetical protein
MGTFSAVATQSGCTKPLFDALLKCFNADGCLSDPKTRNAIDIQVRGTAGYCGVLRYSSLGAAGPLGVLARCSRHCGYCVYCGYCRVLARCSGYSRSLLKSTDRVDRPVAAAS